MGDEELLMVALLQKQQNNLKSRVEETERWQRYDAEGLTSEEIILRESARLNELYEASCRSHGKMKRTIVPALIVTLIALFLLRVSDAFLLLMAITVPWFVIALFASIFSAPARPQKSLSWELAEKRLAKSEPNS